VVAGQLSIGGHSAYFQTGNAIMASPLNSSVFVAHGLHRIASARKGQTQRNNERVDAIPMALFDANHLDAATEGGRVAVFGDSTCSDANQLRTDCFWTLDMMLRFAMLNEMDSDLKDAVTEITEATVDGIFSRSYLSKMKRPVVRESVRPQFERISRVHRQRNPQCPEGLFFAAEPAEGGGQRMGRQRMGAEPDGPRPQKAKAPRIGYKFVVEPHRYGHVDPLREGELGLFEDVMFFYPFAAIAVLLIAMYCFCAPIRRLIPCGHCGAKNNHISYRTHSRIRGDRYYHV